MKGRTWVMAGITLVGVIWAVQSPGRDPRVWQELVKPGPLSSGHAFLEGQCGACHVSVEGVPAERCIACHATNHALLESPRTAFHATVTRCVDCHGEHVGSASTQTTMDHLALAKLGLRGTEPPSETMSWLQRELSSQRVVAAARRELSPHARDETALLLLLNCASCHASQPAEPAKGGCTNCGAGATGGGGEDKHQGLFGRDCGSCHGTDHWRIANYRHPSPRSRDCVECHQAPPSHFMMHFSMVSRRVAGEPTARVEQCFMCHTTISWNEIRNVGFYKHH